MIDDMIATYYAGPAADTVEVSAIEFDGRVLGRLSVPAIVSHGEVRTDAPPTIPIQDAGIVSRVRVRVPFLLNKEADLQMPSPIRVVRGDTVTCDTPNNVLVKYS